MWGIQNSPSHYGNRPAPVSTVRSVRTARRHRTEQSVPLAGWTHSLLSPSPAHIAQAGVVLHPLNTRAGNNSDVERSTSLARRPSCPLPSVTRFILAESRPHRVCVASTTKSVVFLLPANNQTRDYLTSPKGLPFRALGPQVGAATNQYIIGMFVLLNALWPFSFHSPH